MKFIHQKDGSMNIVVDDIDDYECTDDNGVDVILSQDQVDDLFNSFPRPHTSAPIEKECRSCFGKNEDCPCEDECNIVCYCIAYSEARSMQRNIQWAVDEEHDAAIRNAERNATLDAIVEFIRGNSETIEAYDGTLEDAVFLGELLAKIESLRTAQHTGDDGK